MRKIIREDRAVFFSALTGAFLFFCIYGVSVLNPGYDDWLMRGGDMAQHYLGWVAYRNSPWTFPLGMTDHLAYPYAVSIVFTDSIPLCAMIGKILSPFLPPVFQYFGFWGLLCFILNGAAAAKLLKRYMKDDLAVILGSVFFILSFQTVSRMFVHTSLASHWLILMAMIGFAYRDSYFATRKAALWWWGFLAFLCSTIHLYFIPMCGIILLGFILADFLEKRDWKKGLLLLGTYLTVTLATLFLLGSFTGEISYVTETLGRFSFNLNGFFNSMDTGRFLKALPSFEDQYEGYAYLGMGIFILLPVTAFYRLRFCRRNGCSERHKREMFCSGLICLAAVIVAASPVVTWGETVLFTYSVPEALRKVWDAFRSSGRFSWIVIYFLFLFAVCADARVCPRQLKRGILIFCLSLQLLDVSVLLQERHDWLSVPQEYHSPLQSTQWELLCKNDRVRHLLVYPELDWGLLKALAEQALKSGKTINQFYMARVDADIRGESIKHLSDPREDVAYIWGEDDTLACTNPSLFYYYIDGFVAGLPEPLPGVEPLSLEEESLGRCRYFFNGANLTGGYDEDGVRYLEPGGTSYGPYAWAPAGDYQVVIRGENLEGNTVESYAAGGTVRYEIGNYEESEEEITFTVHLEESVSNLEVEIRNTNSHARIMKIKTLTIRALP